MSQLCQAGLGLLLQAGRGCAVPPIWGLPLPPYSLPPPPRAAPWKEDRKEEREEEASSRPDQGSGQERAGGRR